MVLFISQQSKVNIVCRSFIEACSSETRKPQKDTVFIRPILAVVVTIRSNIILGESSQPILAWICSASRRTNLPSWRSICSPISLALLPLSTRTEQKEVASCSSSYVKWRAAAQHTSYPRLTRLSAALTFQLETKLGFLLVALTPLRFFFLENNKMTLLLTTDCFIFVRAISLWMT